MKKIATLVMTVLVSGSMFVGSASAAAPTKNSIHCWSKGQVRNNPELAAFCPTYK